MKFTYILVITCAVIVPFIFSFHSKLRFDRNFMPFFTANLISAFIFLLWDYAFTSMGVWGFNEDYITGFRIVNLPVEEVLFFIFIPFACMFTYHCITSFKDISWSDFTQNIVVLLLCILLLITGILCIDKLYTSATFISAALLLLIYKYLFKVTWLPQFFSVYIILLIPFLIVNGILTGTGPDNPVVWYNDAETLGIRILTIPLEDVIYGMELLMLNTFLYEEIKNPAFEIPGEVE